MKGKKNKKYDSYRVSAGDVVPFGRAWCGPQKFRKSKKTLVAHYKKKEEDGQGAKVYCVAMPARFYFIKALAGKDSCGDPLNGYKVSTGSEQAQLAADIAKAISRGMLGFKPGRSRK